MKITDIRAIELPPAESGYDAVGRRGSWIDDTEVANPMSHYTRFKAHRDSWRSGWRPVACEVTADDGSTGTGRTVFGAPVAAIVNDHLGPLLVGENAADIAGLWEMMTRLVSPYGHTGLASYAISAIDLALWDLNAKRAGLPVHTFAGGPVRETIACYATGNDTDWHMELGFGATKLACPHGPADGEAGLEANADLVARTRELIGPDTQLMLDCWMAFDVDYAIELSERLKPYDVDWIEDCLTPEDIEAHHELRRRLKHQRYATGEHWYGTHMFAHAARHRLADIFQPDICWAGGFTACRRIAEIADEAGIEVIPHAGMNTAFGQHFTAATPNAAMGECFIGSPPGIPLEEAADIPVPVDGVLRAADGPGFGGTS